MLNRDEMYLIEELASRPGQRSVELLGRFRVFCPRGLGDRQELGDGPVGHLGPGQIGEDRIWVALDQDRDVIGTIRIRED